MPGPAVESAVDDAAHRGLRHSGFGFLSSFGFRHPAFELSVPPRILTALPVYNEARHVEAVLDEVRRYAGEILVVDDGSSDATPVILSRQSDLRIVTHEHNRGYGAALQSAFAVAQDEDFDVLVTIDCDGQHEPRLIPELAARVFPATAAPPRKGDSRLENDEGDGPLCWAEPFDIVSGSRYLKQFDGDSLPPEDRRRINATITARLNELLGLNLTDAFCGFKAYRVDALSRLNITEDGYGMPLELWIQAAAAGFRMVEFPVPLVYLEEERSFGGSLDDARRRMAYYEDVMQRACAALSVPTACR
ncbi:MAG: glycosyltransferase family 2 protein [Planctomycetes bacterium]|nr:glycosyltransferase family 2 protein [Planctomycetota bacterium]